MTPEGSYASFDLWITPDGSRYRTRAVSFLIEEEGSFQELPALPLLVEGSRATGGRNLRPEADDPAFLKPRDFGELLFRTVFTGSIASLFETSRERARAKGLQLRLFLHLEAVPELSRLPWEYLYHPVERMFLGTRISIVRYLATPEAYRPLSVKPPLRVLVVRASPKDREPLSTEEEWQHIQKSLGRFRLSRRARVETLEPPTFEALEEKLRSGPWHVLHFIGHGGFEESASGRLVFAGEDGSSAPIDAQRISALLHETDIRLVVLNACEGARSSATEVWSGLAQELIHKGIPAVVAMQFEIADQSAVRFARRFYQSLSEGEPIDAAVTAARRSLFLHGGDVEWGTPVLYTRSRDGNLFKVPPLSRGERLRRCAVRYGWIPALVLIAGVVGYCLHRTHGRQDVPPDDLVAASPQCPSPPGTDIRFALIPKGTFMMGANRKGERPEHEVEITRPFCMGQFEVTQRQWAQVMTGKTDLPTDPLGDRPKTDVSLDQIHEFLARLNQRAGRSRFRLPYEAEWEYAARAGSTTRFSFGNDPLELYEHGHCRSKSGRDDRGNLAAIGQYKPNRWNLYDMYGNAWEAVEDYYDDYHQGSFRDPKGPTEGFIRVRRGGSYQSKADRCSSPARDRWNPTVALHDLGFRIVEELP